MRLFRLLIGFPRGLFLGFGIGGPVVLFIAITNPASVKSWNFIYIQCASLCIWWFLVVWEYRKRKRVKHAGTMTAAVKKMTDEGLQAGLITLFVDQEGVRRCPHCKHSVESSENIEEWEKHAP